MTRNGYSCRWGSWVLVAVCLLTMVALPAMGQTAGTGALAGTVTDSTGAVVPNVKVTVVSEGTGQERSGVTAGDGSYSITLLNPGNYHVKFEATGFQTIDIPSVTVTV